MGSFAISVTPEQFSFLGSLSEGERNIISPFTGEAATSVINKENIDWLRELKLVTDAGKLTNTASEIFTQLNKPDSFAEFIYCGSQPIIDAAVYFGEKRSISVVSMGETILVSSPAETKSILNTLEQFMGSTRLLYAALDTVMSLPEALVLVGILDQIKRAMLQEILDIGGKKAGAISAENVSEWLIHPTQNPQWLTVHFKNYFSVQEPIPPEMIKAGLAGLTKAGLIKKDGKSIIPGELLTACASRFITIEHFLVVRAAQIASTGDLVASQFEVLRSGHNGLLLWDAVHGDKVHLFTLSPLMLMVILASLCDPEALKKLGEKSITKMNEAAACKKCGTGLAPDAEFCSKCGQPTKKAKESEEISCAQCGRKMPHDAKFCDGCGTAVE